MIDLFLILIIIILVIVAILLYNQFQKKESLINSLNLRINFLTKQLSEQPEKLQLEEFMSKKKERLMGDEIIEKFMKDKKIEFTKIVDNDDRSEYRLLNSPAENFYCYAWKKNEIVMFRSPIIELIKYDGGELYEGKDVYEKVLHFCDDFNSHSLLEYLSCYITDFKDVEDEEESKYIVIRVEYRLLGVSQSGLNYIFDEFQSIYSSIDKRFTAFRQAELNLYRSDEVLVTAPEFDYDRQNKGISFDVNL